MTRIDLDASGWQSKADFYAALLPALGSPGWHGGTLDALFDSLGGGILAVQPPFTVTLSGLDHAPPELRLFLDRVATVFTDARAEFGTQVFLELRDGGSKPL